MITFQQRGECWQPECWRPLYNKGARQHSSLAISAGILALANILFSHEKSAFSGHNLGKNLGNKAKGGILAPCQHSLPTRIKRPFLSSPALSVSLPTHAPTHARCTTREDGARLGHPAQSLVGHIGPLPEGARIAIPAGPQREMAVNSVSD
jgi:hypothetical protein